MDTKNNRHRYMENKNFECTNTQANQTLANRIEWCIRNAIYKTVATIFTQRHTIIIYTLAHSRVSNLHCLCVGIFKHPDTYICIISVWCMYIHSIHAIHIKIVQSVKWKNVASFFSLSFFFGFFVVIVYIYFIGQATYCGRQVFVVVAVVAVAVRLVCVCVHVGFSLLL